MPFRERCGLTQPQIPSTICFLTDYVSVSFVGLSPSTFHVSVGDPTQDSFLPHTTPFPWQSQAVSCPVAPIQVYSWAPNCSPQPRPVSGPGLHTWFPCCYCFACMTHRDLKLRISHTERTTYMPPTGCQACLSFLYTGCMRYPPPACPRHARVQRTHTHHLAEQATNLGVIFFLTPLSEPKNHSWTFPLSHPT